MIDPYSISPTRPLVCNPEPETDAFKCDVRRIDADGVPCALEVRFYDRELPTQRLMLPSVEGFNLRQLIYDAHHDALMDGLMSTV